ncbi:MAG: hypothetical protein ACOYJV_10280 [Aminivibrio sp.]|jgi:tRNA nucleotidyltransferase/poly(A) polymerase
MSSLLEDGMALVRRLEEEGHEAFLVGGAVRDLLCGFSPVDLDIATDAPLEVMVSLFPSGKAIGPGGRQTFHVSAGEGFAEVCSFKAGKLREDLARRDFTVNALALSRGGEILGSRRSLADITARILRFNGPAETRLAEDPLRALRLARLAAVLPGFSIFPEASEACASLRPSVMDCAPERIGREVGIALKGRGGVFLESLRKCGLLRTLFPWLSAREFEFKRLCGILEKLNREGASLETRAAALLSFPASLAAPEKAGGGEAALEGWKWAARSVSEAAELAANRRIILESPDPERMAALFESRGLAFMDSLFQLSRHFCKGEHHFRRWSENRRLFVSMAVRALRVDDLPSGEEIMETFSLEPEPLVGELANAAKLRRLFPGLASKEEALRYLSSLILKNDSNE